MQSKKFNNTPLSLNFILNCMINILKRKNHLLMDQLEYNNYEKIKSIQCMIKALNYQNFKEQFEMYLENVKQIEF